MTIYKDDLERVYKLIEKEENWTQGEFAKTRTGEVCKPKSRKAKCWCIDGAAMKVIRPARYNYTQLGIALGISNPIRWNDEHTHAEVLDLLRKAIERAPVRPS